MTVKNFPRCLDGANVFTRPWLTSAIVKSVFLHEQFIDQTNRVMSHMDVLHGRAHAYTSAMNDAVDPWWIYKICDGGSGFPTEPEENR